MLHAAVELVAERGVHGVTHREVARRAGLPLSATSYFFASIDELVLEAMGFFMAQFAERMDAVTRAISDQRLAPAKAADLIVTLLLSTPEYEITAQFEGYLEATRRPRPVPEVTRTIEALERLAEATLAAAGARNPPDGARAFIAMLDGFALNRLAWPRGTRDRTALRDAILSLFIAYTMDEEERADWARRLRQTPSPAAGAAAPRGAPAG